MKLICNKSIKYACCSTETCSWIKQTDISGISSGISWVKILLKPQLYESRTFTESTMRLKVYFISFTCCFLTNGFLMKAKRLQLLAVTELKTIIFHKFELMMNQRKKSFKSWKVLLMLKIRSVSLVTCYRY